MFFKPAILSLLLGAFVISGLVMVSSVFGWQILRYWDLQSGSERQIRLEKQTYLISALMTYAFVYQLLSFFLFIYTVDRLHPYFVGAMCAAGSLQVNRWGYPVMLAKLVNFFLAGAWLILNHIDNQGYDYPLVRFKYGLLLAIMPFILCETLFLIAYFAGLQPELITSCCGSLFTASGQGVAGELVFTSHPAILGLFLLFLLLTFFTGWRFSRTGTGGYGFSLLASGTFVLAVLSFISFFSVYYYELPTHHCPFCILQAEYNYQGYLIYAAALIGGLAGLSIMTLLPFRQQTSLKEILPRKLRTLTLLSLSAYAVFVVLVCLKVITSNLTMF